MSSANAVDARVDGISPLREGELFRFVRNTSLKNIVRQLFSHGRLRVALFLFLSTLMWVGLFALFAEGFIFLRNYIADAPTHDETVRAVYNVFFASLTVMLLLSTALIVYAGLYRSEEARFLLTTPARAERIFLYKFPEAMFYACSGFVLLGSPMLLAFGAVHKAPWPYFVMLLPFMLAFSYIAGSLGAILCLAVMRFAPRKKARLFTWLGIAVAIIVIRIVWNLASYYQTDLVAGVWFRDLLRRLRFSEARLLPNWWLSSGLLEAARGGFDTRAAQRALAESVMFLAVCVSNALLIHQLAVVTAGRLYRKSYQEWHGQRSARRRLGIAWIDRMLMRLTWFGTPEIRLLILKDFRLFRRDPVQWSQFLIFFGLLFLYFFNTRWLRYDTQQVAWVHMISYMNLAVVGLILSTFTTRFIFPLISLEGRRFWILGLLPIHRDTILWEKYIFAAVGSLIPCMLLVWLSDLMLNVGAMVIGIHLALCVLICSGLAAIAVGLGARLPNLREDSPSRIAAGFGGTLNLVFSAVFIIAVIMLTAIPGHFYVTAIQGGLQRAGFFLGHPGRTLLLGLGTSVALSLFATIVPMRIGVRAFRSLEF